MTKKRFLKFIGVSFFRVYVFIPINKLLTRNLAIIMIINIQLNFFEKLLGI